MIIKGSSRGQNRQDSYRLARHLLADENETVTLMALNGVSGDRLEDAIEELRLLSLGTRARRGLYHCSINLDRKEATGMTDAKWLECVDELARRLGMAEHPRAVVGHVKHGREHVHVVFSRVHPLTLKVARDSHNYKIHEECSRVLEARFGLRRVDGALTRAKGRPRPVAKATHADWQASERTGIKIDDVSAAIRRAWYRTDTGAAFAHALTEEHLCLARGRRGIIAVDAAGTPHSLSRRLGLRAGEVKKRLAGLDVNKLPTLTEAKSMQAERQRGKSTMSRKRQFGATQRQGQRRTTISSLPADYWRELGYSVEEGSTFLGVKVSDSTTLFDYGDRLMLDREGEPTDDEIRVLVAAGRNRGWEGIRFTGSHEFQRRARLEALRQGYRLDQISLECEDGKQPPSPMIPTPDHIRRKLQIPNEPAVDAPLPEYKPDMRV